MCRTKVKVLWFNAGMRVPDKYRTLIQLTPLRQFNPVMREGQAYSFIMAGMIRAIIAFSNGANDG